MTVRTGPSGSSSPGRLPPGVFLGAAAVMAVLGAVGVVRFVLYRDGPGLGLGTVCLGAAFLALASFPSIRRNREP